MPPELIRIGLARIFAEEPAADTWVSILDSATKLLGVIIWPLVVVFVVIYVTRKYKAQIAKMLDGRLESVEALGVKVLWAAHQALDPPAELVGHTTRDKLKPRRSRPRRGVADTRDDLPAVGTPAAEEEMAREGIIAMIERAVQDASLGWQARVDLLSDAEALLRDRGIEVPPALSNLLIQFKYELWASTGGSGRAGR
ncbi:hypothetical protein [Planotetraspora mira]|uniref:Uncharacterized protein n=1 Tax=Planotetraspora mira TaxID=58121 RepID=A0A8J3TV28_9ACTN|nr:hypothetical protein [Planotetraspora mira]GII32732.1 hypothetical protein Pmi06nite_61740 [Planotetraspora mira]